MQPKHVYRVKFGIQDEDGHCEIEIEDKSGVYNCFAYFRFELVPSRRDSKKLQALLLKGILEE